jgi:hypothetical protein
MNPIHYQQYIDDDLDWMIKQYPQCPTWATPHNMFLLHTLQKAQLMRTLTTRVMSDGPMTARGFLLPAANRACMASM